MGATGWQIAQANIGRIRGPLTDPVMEGFVRQLDRINAVADGSPGFVWRLQTEDGDATAIRPFEDESLLINMSVWDSIPALYEYVYRTEHLKLLRDRTQWFLPLTGPHLVLWWVARGCRPGVEEAKRRLELLERLGPTPEAFTFKVRFPPPGADERSPQPADEWDWAWTR